MIALIPARGGSKGLPGKNIKKLNGKPLIQYTIEAARRAKCIDRVVVTTDDLQIAEIAKLAGAEVPFMRPDYLSSDNASAVDVYLHAMDNLKGMLDNNKFMVLLPTAPLRNETHIDQAYELFMASEAETLVSVKNADVPPNWYMFINENGKLEIPTFASETTSLGNRQSYSSYYIPNGAIYILDYNLLKMNRTYYSDNTVPYVMNSLDSVDIDNIDDFEYAEYLLTKRINN
nr:acylneuraminate cytidylyltransferase family protein [uncultured Butyrivibrio sp.]